MGIYTRDQIQYANMIQNAMQNRARAIEREGDNTRNVGAIWGGAVKDIGSQISNIAMTYAQNQMDTDKMKMQQDFQASEALKRAAEQKAAQDAQRKFQEEQAALNRAQTAEENALNRKNAIEIAAMNKQDTSEDRLMNLERAKKILESKRSALELDPNNRKLIEDYNEAAWTANKWGSKFDDYNPIEYKSFDNLGRDNATAENWIKSELAKKVPWTDERKAELFEALTDIGDQKTIDSLTAEIVNKGRTVEERKAWLAAEKERVKGMTASQKLLYKKNNPKTANAIGL